MATISSHVLDSVTGSHAAGIRISCVRRNSEGATTVLFDKKACEQGRISESVDTTLPGSIELVFHSKDYFAHSSTHSSTPNSAHHIVSEVVVRLDLSDDSGHYHCPMMLSPHSYSIWWSDS